MIVTHEILVRLWKEYWASDLSKSLRFGQFVFNETGYEYLNSYNKENAFEAYSILTQGLEW